MRLQSQLSVAFANVKKKLILSPLLYELPPFGSSAAGAHLSSYYGSSAGVLPPPLPVPLLPGSRGWVGVWG